MGLDNSPYIQFATQTWADLMLFFNKSLKIKKFLINYMHKAILIAEGRILNFLQPIFYKYVNT